MGNYSVSYKKITTFYDKNFGLYSILLATFFQYSIMEDLHTFDKLWDYSNPAATREKFIKIYEQNKNNIAEKSLLTELQTQIARTYSLQFEFEKANEWLHNAELLLDKENIGVEHIRYHLERGRVFNSANNKEAAAPHFNQALTIAEKLQQDFYAIDAAHMLAIIADPINALLWNEKAIQIAEKSAEQRANNWLGALYNNLGWSFFDLKQYESALNIFEKAWQWRKEKGQLLESLIAKWCIGRTLRALEQYENALQLQLDLEKEFATNNLQADGYVFEEIAENYLALKNSEYHSYFNKAYELLSKDIYLHKNEQARLTRMQELAKEKNC